MSCEICGRKIRSDNQVGVCVRTARCRRERDRRRWPDRKDAKREYDAQYRKDHHDAKREYDAQYSREHYEPVPRVACEVCGDPMLPNQTGVCMARPGCRLEYQRRWAQSHRDETRAYSRAWLERQHYLYVTWQGMRKRCLNPNNKDFHRYGGRGVLIYEPWRTDLQAFASWIDANLGQRPDGMTLDRIDNDGNYEPGNLRWADAVTQRANQRTLVAA